MKKVSIVTVAYNSATTLGDTIESVLQQSYSNIEYVIIDGQSTDGTLDIIKQYEPKFNGRMHWISEPDNGIYDAMNKGIKMATGDVVGILNSDDFFMDSDVLKEIMSAFDAGAESICGNLVFIDSNDTNKIVRRWKGSPYRPFATGWHPAHPTFYVRRDYYVKYGGFDVSFHISADFELMLRFIERCKIPITYLDRNIVKMRVGGASTGSIKNILIGNKNIIRAFSKNNIHISVFYPFKRLFPKMIDRLKSMVFPSPVV